MLIKNLRPSFFFRILVILMLIFAMFDNPYFYYQLLRWAVSGLSLYLTLNAYKLKFKFWTWTFGITAIIYNPIAPFYLGRSIWLFCNIVTIILFLLSLYFLDRFALKEKNSK